MTGGFTGLTIHTDIEQNPFDQTNVVDDGIITDIGLLRHGTTNGKASVGLVITLANGDQIIGQTTWALLRTCMRALAASPIVAEEVIDP